MTDEAPLAGSAPLIDAHAHFYHPASGRADWKRVNAARLRAGDRIGITYHVASVLGSYGHTSPTYFPSPADVSVGNDAMAELAHDVRIPELLEHRPWLRRRHECTSMAAVADPPVASMGSRIRHRSTVAESGSLL